MFKKFLLIMLIVLFSSFISYASDIELWYDGETHIYSGPDVKLILNGELFVPSEGQMPPVIIQDRTLVPVREVFEKLNGTVEWEASEKKVTVNFGEKSIVLWIDKTDTVVNGNTISLDVPAKLINSKTMVPVRFISENDGLYVDRDGNTSTVTISKAKTNKLVNINNVSLKKINEVECLVVDVDDKATYNCFDVPADEERPNRIILDIEDSKFNFRYDNMVIENNEFVSQIRFGVQENDVNRIVLDMKKDVEYCVKESNDQKQIYLALSNNFTLEDIKPVEEPIIEEPTINNEDENNSTLPDSSESNDEPINGDENDEEPVLDAVEENIEIEPEIISNITSMKYSTASEKVRIILDGKFEYDISELENPRRIVLDFNTSGLKIDGPTEIKLKNNPISTVEALKNEDGTAKIVITITKSSSYELSKKTSELQVKVEEPEFRNVEYFNKGDYAELILSDANLSDLTKLQSKTTKKYTIKYSSSKFNPGSGALDIDDEFVKKIAVTSTKITITDTGNMKYSSKQVGDDVVFTIKKANTADERIIILDAGHGGNDPGAMNGDDKEKTYNLKILLKLKEMLEDAGYTVYATRTSDVTLTVNDRVYLATKDYPEASLYVSIHNNSLDNKNYSGTLIMYCSRDTSSYGITNKEFATYVLNELVDKLNTVNRGFIEVKEDDTSKRVLTEVHMPSILCEVSFISNDDELARLKTDRFQTLAAEGIFEGIQKALNKMY